MRIAIIGNGDFIPARQVLTQFDRIVAADGGLHHCATLAIAPDSCVGDGDSLTESERHTAPVDLQADQNTTDLQKALVRAQQLAAGQSYSVELFSMTSGSRLDHTLFALQLLATNPIIATLYTPHQVIRCIRQQWSWRGATGRTISLLPVLGSASVTLTGLAWSGDAVQLNIKRPGISNVITADTARVIVLSGAVYSFEPAPWT
jgi:thiamine pyrophosphokinase